MKIQSSSFTHPGYVRKVNEDSYYVNDHKGLWVVCDGMGGHEEGLFCSTLATDSFEALELNEDFQSNTDKIIQMIHLIKKQLDKKASTLKEGMIIGTTLVLLYIKDDEALCISAGDSRCYILREEKLSLVNVDHTKELMLDEKVRSVLTNALFAPGDISIDIKRFIVKKDDRFLLCSDGLYNYLDNKKIKKAMGDVVYKNGLKSLTSSVLENEADDNITAVMVGIS